MKKIIVCLAGGLGNQMFQYAAAKSISEDNGLELVIDDWSGFVRDHQYHRKFELGNLQIKARKANLFERLPVWLHRLSRKLNKKNVQLVEKHWFGTFLIEKENTYMPKITRISSDRSYWMLGYWQSPKYFHHYSEVLHSELMPPEPDSRKILELGLHMRSSESVAVGIRLYEESSDPGAHSKNGKLKTVDEIQIAIDKITKRIPDSQMYIFCTHHSKILNQLNLPKGSVFLTHDDGYEGTFERLWLLSQCRHHIFTNSSYYWWGAWLSRRQHESHQQHIYAADNFINSDFQLADWKTF